jgi:hypothetical protein
LAIFKFLTTSLDKIISATAYTTGNYSQKNAKNTVETLLSVHALHDIERIFDLGRTQKLCTSCMLNLCEYDIYG